LNEIGVIVLRDFATKMRFIELRAEGKSYSEIARELSISKGTCSTWSKELESEIRQLREEQLNELYDQYYLMRSDRIAALAEKVKKLEDEMDRRPISDISTENLWRLYRQFYEMLKNEIIELKTEQWEKSLAAIFLDEDLEDILLETSLIFLDEDRKEAIGCIKVIAKVGRQFVENVDLSKEDRSGYQQAVCRLNTLYRQYGLESRVPITFDLMPLSDQRIFKQIVKGVEDFQDRLKNSSLLSQKTLTDNLREDWLRIVRVREGLFDSYGLSIEGFSRHIFQERPKEMEGKYTCNIIYRPMPED